MASTGNMKISVNVSKANGKVEKEKDGLFPKLRKGGSGSMTERRSGGRGHGELTTAAPNDGSQSARRPGEDKPKGRGKPPLVSSGSSNTKGMDKQRTPRPPSASAPKNGEQSSPSVAPTASATPGSSRATSPFASSTVRWRPLPLLPAPSCCFLDCRDVRREERGRGAKLSEPKNPS
jgi:hypothetical protein